MVNNKLNKQHCRNIGASYLQQGYTFNRVTELTANDTNLIKVCIRQGYLLEEYNNANS